MKLTRTYPRLHIDTAPSNALGHAGGLLLTETVHTSSLGHHLKTALTPWKKPFAVHDPAKILLDLAITLGLGGDALSNTTAVRDEPDLYGPVASNPTITRIIQTLATDVNQGLAAINQAGNSPDPGVGTRRSTRPEPRRRCPGSVDHQHRCQSRHLTQKENAKPTYKKGFGFHPLLAFIDHGDCGTGEPVAELLRPGNAGSNTATDHISLVKLILAQLPDRNPRPGKSASFAPTLLVEPTASSSSSRSGVCLIR